MNVNTRDVHDGRAPGPEKYRPRSLVSRIAGIVIAITFGGGVGYLIKQQLSKPAPAARAPSAAEQRAKAGVFIVTTKQISEHEEIATVVIPSSIGPLLDQQCFIYRHTEYRHASFHCPAERSIDVDAIE